MFENSLEMSPFLAFTLLSNQKVYQASKALLDFLNVQDFDFKICIRKCEILSETFLMNFKPK